jgi:hypothetical protein
MKRWKLFVVVVALSIDLTSARAMAPESELQGASCSPQEVQQCVPPVATETEGAAKSATEKDGPQKNLSYGPTFIMRNETQSDKAQQSQGCTNTESNKWTDPITIFTLLLTGFTGLTWWTYQGILTSTKAIERAYIKMSEKSTLVPIDVSRGREKERGHEMEMEVKNWGNTPALVTHRLLTWGWVPKEEGLPPVPDYGKGKRVPVEAFLVKEDFYIFRGRLDIHPNDMSKCGGARQTHIFYIVGYVDYIDKFGTCHRAGYARRYDPEMRTFNFVTQAGYNYDREYKEEN